MSDFTSTKVIELGSSAFRQWRAHHSHCQYIHGYQLKAKFWFSCNNLDDKNWSADFGGLKELKQILQDKFDHKLLVAEDDPALLDLMELQNKGVCQLTVFPKGVGIERAAEFCFNTASEFIEQKYGNRVWVSKVEVFEHEDNSAVFEPRHTQNCNVSAEVTETTEVKADTNFISDMPEPPREVQRGASIDQQITTGGGNWFAGTSWG